MYHRAQWFRHTDEMFSLREPPQWDGDSPDIYVTIVGIAHCQPAMRHEIFAQRYNLHVIREGKFRILIDGNEYLLQSGDLFILFPGQHAELHGPEDQYASYLWLAFDGKKVDWALAGANLTRRNQVLAAGTDYNALLCPLHERLQNTYRDDIIARMLPVSAAWEILNAISSTEQISRLPADIADAARFLLEESCTTGLSIEDIARTLRISRSTLYRQFIRRFGISPKAYQEKRRLEYACELLKRTRSTVAEVVYMCGFQSPAYFSRIFRKHFGLSPKRWLAAQQKRK
ncbi:MAG: AraC family transcriptional regulator [Lentisphaerae bacterium]|nr:MAG: AraC family transcriptional regulator [Lentisphaerota bacterium]